MNFIVGDGCGHIFLFEKPLKKCCSVFLKRKLREKALFKTASETNQLTIFIFLINGYSSVNIFCILIFSDAFKNHFKIGIIPSCTKEFGRNSGRSAIYSFETNSHQRGYAACLKMFYNEINTLTNDSPVVKSILEIIYKTFQFDSLDFMNSGNIGTPRLVPISSAKMDVLQFLRHILLQHVDLLQVQDILNCVAGKVVWC